MADSVLTLLGPLLALAFSIEVRTAPMLPWIVDVAWDAPAPSPTNAPVQRYRVVLDQQPAIDTTETTRSLTLTTRGAHTVHVAAVSGEQVSDVAILIILLQPPD